MSSPMPPKNPAAPTPTPRIPDPRLLRTTCRFFLKDLIELLHPEMAEAIEFKRIEFLSDETFDDMAQDCRFDADLVVRLEMTEEALRQEEERARARREEQLAEERRWAEMDDEDEVYEAEEDEEDYEDDEAPEVSRYVLVHLVVAEEASEDLGSRLYRHSGYLHLEDHRFPITMALILSGGPAGVEFSDYVQSLGDLELMRFRYLACGLSETRAEEWLERRDRSGKSPALGPALAVWMPWEDADVAQRKDVEQRKHRLERMIGDARINDGRRHFLECLVERGPASELGPDAAGVEKIIARILSEEPMVSSIDVSLFDKLLHAFFADAVGLLGGFGVDGIEFGHLRFLDQEEAGDDPATPEPVLFEWLAEATRRGAADERVLLHLQLARERAGMDEWTLRRYMQLRLRFPGATVVPIVLFTAHATGSQACVCEVKDRNGEEVMVRFRYYGFTLAANSAEDYVEDPRPVAWALAALMRPWRWKPERLKLECLLRIEHADLEIDQRALLWEFVEAHLPLAGEAETELREALREQAVVMRETVIPYLDERLGPLFPSDCRQRLSAAEDPMEVHRLIEQVYQDCVRQGLLPEEEAPAKWSVH